MSSSTIVLELLDAEGGHSIHAWELSPDETIVIGRSRDCTVIISNPYVSRSHACLRFGEEGWEVSATSSQGLIIDGEKQLNSRLTSGREFRLGNQGPWLRFREDASLPGEEASSTMSIDPSKTPIFVLDAEQMSRDVESVVEGEYFARLHEMATRLRKPSETGGPPSQSAN